MIKHMALQQDYMSLNPSSTVYHLGEFGLWFPLLQKDLIHIIVVRFKELVYLHIHTENT